MLLQMKLPFIFNYSFFSITYLIDDTKQKKMIENPFHFMYSTILFILLPSFLALWKTDTFKLEWYWFQLHMGKMRFSYQSMQTLSFSTHTLPPSDIRDVLLLNRKWLLSNKCLLKSYYFFSYMKCSLKLDWQISFLFIHIS